MARSARRTTASGTPASARRRAPGPASIRRSSRSLAISATSLAACSVSAICSAAAAAARGGPQRGADLRYDLEISFEEAARGSETTIQIPRQETCETCSGSGAAPGSSPTTCAQCRGQGQVRFQQGFFTVARTCPVCRGAGRVIAKPCHTCRGAGRVSKERKITVKIPAGIDTGQQLRLQSEGEAGTGGGPPGHLYVVVQVQQHEFFRRDGVNLFCEIPVNFTTVALGGEIQVPTLDEPESVKVPEGTQTGTTLRLRGKGLPDVNGRGRGDLFATVQIADAEEADEGTAPPPRAAGEIAAEGEIRAATRTARNRTSGTCSIGSRICSDRKRVQGAGCGCAGCRVLSAVS